MLLGGAFITLAKYYIEQLKGVVYGAVFNEAFECVHIEGETLADIQRMQNSKYVQSNTAEIYKKVKVQLDNGRPVLFSGTPCQVAGLYSFLRKQYDNLLTIEIICHGVPSPKFWEKYIKNEFRQGALEEYTFRNRRFKEKGGTSFTYSFTYTTKEGEKKKGFSPFYTSAFYNSFLKGYSFRKSCYYCQFSRLSRVADITIGDVDSEKLYPGFHPNECKSSILLNTKKAIGTWNLIKGLFDSEALDLENEARVNLQLRMPSVIPSERKAFYDEVNNMKWDDFSSKYSKSAKRL